MLHVSEGYCFFRPPLTLHEFYNSSSAILLPLSISIVQASTGYKMADPCINTILMHMNGFPVDYPDYIKEDIRELRDYLDEIEKTMNEGDAIDIDLKENRLTEMNEIVAGKKKTVVPDKLLKKDIHIDENI